MWTGLHKLRKPLECLYSVYNDGGEVSCRGVEATSGRHHRMEACIMLLAACDARQEVGEGLQKLTKAPKSPQSALEAWWWEYIPWC